jgi:hypothetical protein
MLIVGRAVAGMGGAGVVNGGLTIISACVPLAKRASTIILNHFVGTADDSSLAAHIGILMGGR